jgi:teichoic acid transport system permease protein
VPRCRRAAEYPDPRRRRADSGSGKASVTQNQAVERRSDFDGDFHVYVPHKAGLPPIVPYVREAWRRRAFAAEMSRASKRAQLSNTVLGRAWNILNPLFLAGIYYLIVWIFRGGKVGPEYFPHLTAGLFAFYFVANSISGGSSSVVGAGKMIMNTAFPRVLLPLSAVRTAFWRFIPTLVVFGIIYWISPLEFSVNQLIGIPWIGFLTVFAFGCAMIFATLTVYFRDTVSFLPYFLRIWLYLSPVIFFPEQLTSLADKYPWAVTLVQLNPLYSLLGGWSEAVVLGEVPPLQMWIGSILWSFGALLIGGFYFVSREREFAVRL